MSAGQTRRYGRRLLNTIAEGLRAPHHPTQNAPNARPMPPCTGSTKLPTWRKNTASQRGVESDVIISKDALWILHC
ncbi:MAG: hypothetical protein R3D55_08655 [Chloroflexota bacterium]